MLRQLTFPTYEAECDSCGATAPTTIEARPAGWSCQLRDASNNTLDVCDACGKLPLSVVLANHEKRVALDVPAAAPLQLGSVIPPSV